MFVDHLSYVERLDKRPLDRIDLVVIHCTELPDLATAREYGERLVNRESRTGNSGHYYIERGGRIEEWVPLDRVAHHVRRFNECSIGIELDHPGRFPHWYRSDHQEMRKPYTRPQLENLVRLINVLRGAIPSLRRVSGHEHLDRERLPAEDDPAMQIRRKVDPGPLFPGPRIISATGLEFFDTPAPALKPVSAGPPR